MCSGRGSLTEDGGERDRNLFCKLPAPHSGVEVVHRCRMNLHEDIILLELAGQVDVLMLQTARSAVLGKHGGLHSPILGRPGPVDCQQFGAWCSASLKCGHAVRSPGATRQCSRFAQYENHEDSAVPRNKGRRRLGRLPSAKRRPCRQEKTRTCVSVAPAALGSTDLSWS